jgi:flagellar hook-associated protein 2
MGTVGINFGSGTSGAGFDVASTVTAILAVSSSIESPWKAQLTTLAAQDTALSSLGTQLSTLSSSLFSLRDFGGLFASKQGSSSDTNVLTLTSASTAAGAGSHTILVESLASTSANFSSNVATASDLLTGTLNIKVGAVAGDPGKTITLSAGGDSLATLAQNINSGSYGVTASVVTSTSGSRLSLVSNTSGAAGQLTVTPSLTDATTTVPVTFPAGVGQPGADAKLNVDGLETTSASNTVTGAIPGVTFQLLSPSTVPVQVQVTNDNTSIETAAQSLVTAYNAIVGTIKTQEGKDATGAAEPLFGDPNLAQVQSQLSSALFSGASSGAIKSLSQLGITPGQDGTLTLDSSTLDAALNSNFSDVQGFFQNAGSFGQNLNIALNNLGSDFSSGVVALALSQNSAEEKSLNTNITNEDARIALQKTTLTAQLNTANQILQSIPAQLNEINEIYSATTGYNTKTS